MKQRKGRGSLASFLFAFLLLQLFARSHADLLPPCDSLIYCHGKLLHTVQMAGIFNDSKHFVDMALKFDPLVILQNFDRFMNATKNDPTPKEVTAFVNMNFREPGSAFVPWNPTDWKPDPDFLKNIADPDLEEWARSLNELWKLLGKKTSPDVLQHPERYSLIYLQNPVIVPGGRFREVYYWDSYWTIEGLLLAGMHETAKGMLENFIELVNRYGKVPNGGRVYYSRRSQPPYLISMVKMYVDWTGDKNFIRNNIGLLEKEFLFWEDYRTTTIRDRESGKVHRVHQYNVQVGGPRPESYKEDYNLAEKLSNERDKEQLYIQLKSGAESGWDYSTRWFVRGDSNNGDLSDLNVTAIAPVDLNSLMCRNAKILSEFFGMVGNYAMASKYSDLALEKNQTLAEVFWDDADGIWYDLNIHTMKKRKFFYLSNIHPLWSGCYGIENPGGDREDTVEDVMRYLKNNKVMDYIGGVPTSLKDSEEQWDYPNTWPPLQHLVIMSLYQAKHLEPEADALAFELAEKWIHTNYLGYKKTLAMFEKYDATVLGVAGTGGEYEVQIGFGWTNGVAIKLLSVFGDRLTATTGHSERISVFAPIIFALPTVLLFFTNRKMF